MYKIFRAVKANSPEFRKYIFYYQTNLMAANMRIHE